MFCVSTVVFASSLLFFEVSTSPHTIFHFSSTRPSSTNQDSFKDQRNTFHHLFIPRNKVMLTSCAAEMNLPALRATGRQKTRTHRLRLGIRGLNKKKSEEYQEQRQTMEPNITALLLPLLSSHQFRQGSYWYSLLLRA